MIMKTAEDLADQLEGIASLVRQAALGQQWAREALSRWVDGYWHKLVVGDPALLAELTTGEGDEA